MTTSSVCTDLVGGSLNCSQTGYQSLIVTLPTIAAGVQYNLLVTNVRNPGSYRPTTTFFTVETKTSDQISSYAKGTISTVFTNSQPSPFTDITYKYVPGAYGSN